MNRTQSTGGIAAKVSLELKKKYLLGESPSSSIQKSGSASTLDSKFKSFRSTITDCQKLLKPAPEISASMQTFCNKLDERLSPILSPTSPSNQKASPEIIDLTISPVAKDSERPDLTETVLEPSKTESPILETSIKVPEIDWSKNKIESDSLSSSSSSSESDSIEKDQNKPTSIAFENIPRLEVQDLSEEVVQESDDKIEDNLPPDSLVLDANQEIKEIEQSFEEKIEQTKSIASEKKCLNQPKLLPNLEVEKQVDQCVLHVKEGGNESGRSSPSNDSGGEYLVVVTVTGFGLGSCLLGWLFTFF